MKINNINKDVITITSTDMPNLNEYDINKGKKLPRTLRLEFEAFFKADFSKVRVHEGLEALHLGALAFTTGSEIFFAQGCYNPNLQSGRRLIAHELTHVVQQREGRLPKIDSELPYLLDDSVLEDEAEHCAQAFISGQLYAHMPRGKASEHKGAAVLQAQKVDLIPTKDRMKSKEGKGFVDDFITIQQILTTPSLFMPPLYELERQLTTNKKSLSGLLLAKEQEHGINIQGAPIYIGVLAAEDFAREEYKQFKKETAVIPKDMVSSEHGEFTHRLHWYIIMFYIRNKTINGSAIELLSRTGNPFYKIQVDQYPVKITELDDEPPRFLFMSEQTEDSYMWLALFDRTIPMLPHYKIEEDWLTVPEIFTALLLDENVVDLPKECVNARRKPNTLENSINPNDLYTLSNELPKLSCIITLRYIKRSNEFKQAKNFTNAEKIYKQRKAEKYTPLFNDKVEPVEPDLKVELKNIPLQTELKLAFDELASVLEGSDEHREREEKKKSSRESFLHQITTVTLASNAETQTEEYKSANGKRLEIATKERKIIEEEKKSRAAERGAQKKRDDLCKAKQIYLQEIIVAATTAYVLWSSTEKRRFAVFTHSNVGVIRAERLSVIAQTDNPFRALKCFADNNILDANGRRLSGSTNTNNHSYLSFLLNQFSTYPEFLVQEVFGLPPEQFGHDFTQDPTQHGWPRLRQNQGEIMTLRTNILRAFQSINAEFLGDRYIIMPAIEPAIAINKVFKRKL